MAPLDTVLRAADPAGSARRVGGQWLVRCPSHADRRASLAVKESADGRVLLWCHAGCLTADVIAALGLTWRDLRP